MSIPARKSAQPQVERPQVAAQRASERLTNNLPYPLTSFIGREREVDGVKQLLSTARLLTLTGAGGCGKTRLAIRVASDITENFKHGVWWVELAALMDAGLLPMAVATALGVREPAEQTPADALVRYLGARELLLVLDNCEHLIGACAQLAQALLSTCPQLKILATSREALGIIGETAWLVPSLALPDNPHQAIGELARSEAVRLFLERIAAVRPDFALTVHNAPAVAQVCQRLDGIPLAIELAAARAKVLPVEQIAARLDDRFNLLTVGSRTALPRQQTLRALIDWSYDLLTDEERIWLRRLAVFAGGWTQEAAQAVCNDEGADLHPSAFRLHPSEVLDLLSRLVDKSLVIAEHRSGEARYRMLETVRQYAAERLSEAGEVASTRDRHLRHFLALAEAGEPKLRGAEQLLWLRRLRLEHDNLQSAMQWSLANPEQSVRLEAGLRLSGALAWFWIVQGEFVEGLRALKQALLLVDNSHIETPAHLKRAHAKALHGAGMLSWFRSDMAAALQWFEQAESVW